jgi:hypothetical protein
MTPAARARAYRRHLRKEMARLSELAAQRMAEAIAEGLLDPIPTQTVPAGQVLEGHQAASEGAKGGVVIEGRIIDGKIITD